MACGCTKNRPYRKAPCEVHKLLIGDKKPRMVKYCKMCGVYLCKKCEDDYILRFFAMLLKKIEL